MEMIITKNTPFGEEQLKRTCSFRSFVGAIDTIGTNGITNITLNVPNEISVSRYSIDEHFYIEIKSFPYGLCATSWWRVINLINALADYNAGKYTPEIKQIITNSIVGLGCFRGVVA